MRPEVNSNRLEISLGIKNVIIHVHETHETHFGANFTSVKLTEVKFQTAVNFPYKKWMLAVK